MGSFRWSLLGYRRADVDAAIAAREMQLALAQEECDARFADAAREHGAIVAEMDRELTTLSGMVIERERDVSELREELRLANERRDRSLASLERVAECIDELHEQARGQATRIRMKALGEAAEVSRRARELAGRLDGETAGRGIPASLEELESLEAGAGDPGFGIRAAANGNGSAGRDPEVFFEGLVEIEIGPLGDFSQLVGFEDAATQIGAATGISVKRFSEGRATIAMELDEPVDLLRELERRYPLDFSVRERTPHRIVLDVEAGGETRAA